MILVEVPTGLLAWLKHDIATIMPEARGRYRVVRCCGLVAHIPGPPPEGPWVPLADGWANERWLQWSERNWTDPAGFHFPLQPLAQVAPPVALPALSGVPCAREQIYAMTRFEDKHMVWHTDRGDFPTDGWTEREARELAPELVELRSHEYLNRLRLASFVVRGANVHISLDNGHQFVCSRHHRTLAHELGLQTYRHLQPHCSGFDDPYYVRDWPFDLLLTPGDTLRNLFPNSRMLTGNVIWQRFRYRSQGDRREWPDSYQGLWYDLKACLSRSGFLRPGSIRAPRVEEKLKLEMFLAMSRFVKGAGFFNFRQFGFVEQHPELRRVGTRRPHILLVTEKKESEKFAVRLAEEFGVSMFLLGGQPPLAATEFFSYALLEAGIHEVMVLALVDYDPSGWIIARATGAQLESLGIRVGGVHFLIRGETFSAEEKRLYAHPCPAGLKTQNRKWLAETGGVDGQAFGIHANHVQPYERVRRLFLEQIAALD